MRYPNTGLYHYCLNLGIYVNRLLETEGMEPMRMYVPPREVDSFGSRSRTITQKPWHKFFQPFLLGCKIWHAPFQSGRMIPQNRKGIKVVLTIHDLNPLHENHLTPADVRKSIAHTQWLIDQSNVLVCISDFCKQDVLSHCNVGNKPIYVIHNGTHNVGEPKLEMNSYRPKRPFLFAMGDVNRKKNFHTLVPLLEGNNYELVIAGRLAEGDYIEAMKKEAVALDVSERLKILGPVTEGEKGWYFENCAGYLHPSLAEGFGAPVVEAMAFGKPLFLSHRTSLPEIGGDVAFYFKNFEPAHMQDVLRNGMESFSRNGLADKVKARGATFNWEQKAKQYLDVYKTLV